MKIAELIDDLPIVVHAGTADIEVTDVVEDSRRAAPGSLFVARGGRSTDGRRFVADAAARGAAAILCDRPIDAPRDLTVLLGRDPIADAVALANRFHGNPAGRLKLIGVTGTNGKTTTAWMVRHLLQSTGHRCGLIGTVETDDGAARRPAELTTPGAVDLIGLLGRMVAHGCDSCVMEVSSHALDQGRVDPLDFAIAVFTNLSGDHLDYHGTMDAYTAAKARLFAALSPDASAVVNADDPASPRVLAACRAHTLTFGFDADRADCRAHVVEATAVHTDCRFEGPWGRLDARLPLIGRHNVANMAAALTAVHALGPGAAAARSRRIWVESCPAVPGRLEPVRIDGTDLPFQVIVDYAHTDDALANVLRALRPVTAGRLRVLFGCGGDRDPTKRPRMGAVACELADDLVITSDNPRTEDPRAIVDQVLTGAPAADRDRVRVMIDRAEAIRAVIADAQPGDVVLLAGKGHEDYQIIGTEKRPFDDRRIARRAIEEAARSTAGWGT